MLLSVRCGTLISGLSHSSALHDAAPVPGTSMSCKAKPELLQAIPLAQ